MTKYLFLDFDGVLNTTQHQAQCNVLGLPDSDKYGPIFDPKTVSNLQCLLDETGAEVVIISSWRYILSDKRLKEMWVERGLPETPILILDQNREMPDLNKGEQIADFMSGESNPYVILDDEPEEFLDSQLSHLIHINPVTGFKRQNVDQAIRSLNKYLTVE